MCVCLVNVLNRIFKVAYVNGREVALFCFNLGAPEKRSHPILQLIATEQFSPML